MSDRLPSLVALVGFWIPPAIAGWVAAGIVERATKRVDDIATYAVLGAFVVSYSAIWFLFNLGRIPSYVAGASLDPTAAPPRAVPWLAAMSVGIVMPGSAIACALVFWRRRRMLNDPDALESLAGDR